MSAAAGGAGYRLIGLAVDLVANGCELPAPPGTSALERDHREIRAYVEGAWLDSNQSRRGAADCGEYRRAAGAIAEGLIGGR